MPKIAVIANCQAPPVAILGQALAPGIEIVGTFRIHLTSPQEEATLTAACDAADIILAQLVQDAYPVPFLRSAALKSAYPGKVILWPNLFFRGQCPDLFYATGPERQRLIGPLGGYHLRGVLEAWRAALPLAEALHRLAAGEMAVPPDVGAASLRDLQRREAACDVRASDLIEHCWRHERLFFTFNHPRSQLLDAMTRRLLGMAGIPTPGAIPPRFGEPLSRVIPPMTCPMQQAAGLDFGEAEEALRGVPYPAIQSAPIAYTLPQLLETFYRAYDDQPELARTARLS